MTYVIAGGGTGGHVFPAIAVADAIKQIDPNASVVFIGTQRGLEDVAVPKAGYELERIVISGLKGRSRVSQFQALLQLPQAIYQSAMILRRHKAKAILGVGGYASGPALIAAMMLGIPIGICEPNTVPGLTNRVLGRFARKIFTAFKSTSAFFSPKKICLVGNALRSKLLTPPHKETAHIARILVLGGSQGARALNQKLPMCFEALKQSGVKFAVWHQTGKADTDSTIEVYQSLGIEAKVTAFIDDMSVAYDWADLLVCRSGATTCSEVLAAGPAVIYIPLPSAIYDHQMLNARELADEGAALVVPQDEITPAGLAQTIANLLKDPNRITSMISRARDLARPNASAEIAKSFLNRFSVGIILLCGTHFFTVV